MAAGSGELGSLSDQLHSQMPSRHTNLLLYFGRQQRE